MIARLLLACALLLPGAAAQAHPASEASVVYRVDGRDVEQRELELAAPEEPRHGIATRQTGIGSSNPRRARGSGS